jgi:hypothetical protein
MVVPQAFQARRVEPWFCIDSEKMQAALQNAPRDQRADNSDFVQPSDRAAPRGFYLAVAVGRPAELLRVTTRAYPGPCHRLMDHEITRRSRSSGSPRPRGRPIDIPHAHRLQGAVPRSRRQSAERAHAERRARRLPPRVSRFAAASRRCSALLPLGWYRTLPMPPSCAGAARTCRRGDTLARPCC